MTAGDGLDREAVQRRAVLDDLWCPTPVISPESWGGGDIREVPCGDCTWCRARDALEAAEAESIRLSAEVERLRVAYADLSDAVAGPPGGTCTQVESMSDTEWLRRHWRNAIDQWKWWKAEAEHLAGPQPVTLVIRATNWEARARDAEALLRTEGGAKSPPHLNDTLDLDAVRRQAEGAPLTEGGAS